MGELNQGALNFFVLLFLGLPFLKEGLVGVFEENSHGAEACSLEVKVEVHVVFGSSLVLSGYHLNFRVRKIFLFLSLFLV